MRNCFPSRSFDGSHGISNSQRDKFFTDPSDSAATNDADKFCSKSKHVILAIVTPHSDKCLTRQAKI